MGVKQWDICSIISEPAIPAFRILPNNSDVRHELRQSNFFNPSYSTLRIYLKTTWLQNFSLPLSPPIQNFSGGNFDTCPI